MQDHTAPSYFQARGVDPNFYQDYSLPKHILEVLPADRASSILDIGCGLCQVLKSLRTMGYTNVSGVDIASAAVEHGLANDLDVSLIDDLGHFLRTATRTYDLVLMSHVIEHISKDQIIEILHLIRTRILSSSGALYLATPNAQAPTNCYWAYEDFTHTTIFTGGSIMYVLRRAGYETITFLDPDGLTYLSQPKRIVKYTLQLLYRLTHRFWNRVMTCTYHKASPQIYAWELRLIAR